MSSPAQRPSAIDTRHRALPFVRTAGLTLLVFGIVVTVIGAFAPWLQSGETTRNSFQVAGTAERFGLLDNPALHAIVDNWALLGPILMIPLICTGLRWWRACAMTAMVIGVAIAALALTVTIAVGDRQFLTISMVAAGPVTVIAGGILITVAGSLILLSGRRDSLLRW